MRFSGKDIKELEDFRKYSYDRKHITLYFILEVLLQLIEIRALLENCNNAGDGSDDTANHADDC